MSHEANNEETKITRKRLTMGQTYKVCQVLTEHQGRYADMTLEAVHEDVISKVGFDLALSSIKNADEELGLEIGKRRERAIGATAQDEINLTMLDLLTTIANVTVKQSPYIERVKHQLQELEVLVLAAEAVS